MSASQSRSLAYRPTSSLEVISSDVKASERASFSDSAALRRTLESRMAEQRLALQMTETLLEPVVSRADFKLALPHLTLETYHSVLHERHSSSTPLCSYPLCSNPPARPYRAYAVPRSRIVRGRIEDVEGNSSEGWCLSTKGQCERRSEWVERSGLLRAAEDGHDLSGGELLEEVEERLERERTGQAMEMESLAEPDDTIASPIIVHLPPPPPIPSTIESFLSRLQIHERPTPSAPPLPPSLASPSITSSPSTLPPSRPKTSALSIRQREAQRRLDSSASALVPSSFVGQVGDLTLQGAAVLHRTAVQDARAGGEVEMADGDAMDEDMEEEEDDGLELEWAMMAEARQLAGMGD